VFGAGFGSGAGTGAIGVGATAVSVLGVVDADLPDATAGGALGAVPGEAMGFGSGGARDPAAVAFMVEAAAVSGLTASGRDGDACPSGAGDSIGCGEAGTTGATKVVPGDTGLAARA
jgi:hypothetical protein